jgi:hydrogenase large subunit
MVTHLLGNNQKISRLINEVMSHFNFKGDISPFFSVMGRHIIRAMEAKVIAEEMAGWILNLDPKEKIYRIDYIMPENKDGFSILESPGGAVGHWIQIRDSAIKNYQIIGSGGWNASPRDDDNQPGPIEKALEDVQVKDRKDTLMLLRIARSFDPCMNCAIH